MSRGTEILVAVAAIIVIVAGIVYFERHVNAACTDFLFWRHCGVTIPK